MFGTTSDHLLGLTTDHVDDLNDNLGFRQTQIGSIDISVNIVQSIPIGLSVQSDIGWYYYYYLLISNIIEDSKKNELMLQKLT